MQLCLSGNEIHRNSVVEDNKEKENQKEEQARFNEQLDLSCQINEKIEKRKLQFKIRRLQPDSANSKKIKVNRRKKAKMETDVVKKTGLLLKKKSEKPIVIKKKQPVGVETKLRCLARIANGEQCRRTRPSQEELCSCHRKHCPYGRINGPLQGKFISIPRKRGPKIRNVKEYKLEELDQGLYQQTDVIKIDTDLYLIDQYGLLFKNDSSCEIVGKRMGDEIHWYN